MTGVVLSLARYCLWSRIWCHCSSRIRIGRRGLLRHRFWLLKGIVQHRIDPHNAQNKLSPFQTHKTALTFSVISAVRTQLPLGVTQTVRNLERAGYTMRIAYIQGYQRGFIEIDLSVERILPRFWNASRVYDFLGLEEFCQLVYRLGDLRRDLLVSWSPGLLVHRVDH